MVTTTRASAAPAGVPHLPLVPLGLGISLFLEISYVLCILLGLIWPDGGLHQPWLQFLPGFTYLTWQSFILGAVETFAYGWYAALVFGFLFNTFAGRSR